MANEEQLKILRQGVRVWNEWRQTHPKEDIDLSGACLSNANFREANLWGAPLTKGDLRYADRIRTNLAEAACCEANFEKAYLGGVIFGDTNLTATKGLDTCGDSGLSTVEKEWAR